MSDDNIIMKTKISRKSLLLIIFVSLVGLVLAGYASLSTLVLQIRGLENPSACTINDWINCDVAQASSHALWFGIPSAWFGFLYYLSLVIAMTWAAIKPRSQPIFFLFSILLSLVSIIVTIYKAVILFSVLKVVCLVCVALYGVNIVLFLLLLKNIDFRWLSLFRRSREDRAEKKVDFRYALKYAVVALVIFGAGIGAARYVISGFFRVDQINPAEEIARHFTGRSYPALVTAKAPVWGNPGADVTLVEYSDFQCPHCRHAAFHLRSILWEYRQDVRLYFMNFPLDKKINQRYWIDAHDQAGMAARAVVCAHEFGNFWDYHDTLFREQGSLSHEFVLNLAERFGWNREEFAAKMEAPETYQRVQEEIAYGLNAGVRSTPALFINGRRVKYWSHPKILRGIIEEERRRAQEKS